MACICSEQDESRRGRASEAAHVAYCVAGDVEEIKRPVTEVVIGFEVANFEGGREGDFLHFVVPASFVS